MRTEKIQAGLRIPAETHKKLTDFADKTGISLNSAILLFVHIGMSVAENGFIPPDTAESPHAPPRNQPDSAK